MSLFPDWGGAGPPGDRQEGNGEGFRNEEGKSV